MIQFPNAKINIGLTITQKREDGFHNIETIFYPIAIIDSLEFIESDNMTFEMSGISVPGKTDDNIIVKAYNLLKKDFPTIAPLHIFLLKKIPTGGGLGGGSADASFMLMMMNKYFQLEISKQKLLTYALQLGSDCPFFIHNQPCKASGRGEILTPFSLNLSSYQFVIINPKIHVHTAIAFSQIVPQKPIKSVFEIIEQPIETWQNELINDFELPIFKEYPLLSEIKNKLYSLGAIYASMSGSGSTIFGIFSIKKEETFYKNEFKEFDVFFS